MGKLRRDRVAKAGAVAILALISAGAVLLHNPA